MDVGAVERSHDSEELTMQTTTTIGLDISKSVFQVLELSPIFGDGLTGQAAAVMGWRSVGLAMTSIPSLNVAPRTSFGNWL